MRVGEQRQRSGISYMLSEATGGRRLGAFKYKFRVLIDLDVWSVQLIENPLKWLDTLVPILDIEVLNLEPMDWLGIELEAEISTNEDRDSADVTTLIYVPFVKVRDFDTSLLAAKANMLSQSRKHFRLDRPFALYLTKVLENNK